MTCARMSHSKSGPDDLISWYLGTDDARCVMIIFLNNWPKQNFQSVPLCLFVLDFMSKDDIVVFCRLIFNWQVVWIAQSQISSGSLISWDQLESSFKSLYHMLGSCPRRSCSWCTCTRVAVSRQFQTFVCFCFIQTYTHLSTYFDIFILLIIFQFQVIYKRYLQVCLKLFASTSLLR